MRISVFIIFSCALVFAASAPNKRKRRAAYDLPDGVHLFVADIRSTFTCPGDGYYADIDNNCQLFHVCHGFDDGSNAPQQWSFACGNQTVFNQFTFTCSFPEEAVPCDRSADFFYLNSRVQEADPDVPFLNDQDVQNAAAVIPGSLSYGSRGNEQPIGGSRPLRG